MPWLMVVAGYILGAIPIGLLIAKWWAGIDVREHGSGNIGATNVYRVVGKPAGILVFVLDVLKGLLPPLIARYLGLAPVWQVAAGGASVLGHTISPFLGFKGGKGVATALGVLFGVAWQVGLLGWAVWGVVLALTRYVSLGSLVAAASLTPLTLYFYPGDTARLLFVIFAAAFTFYKHRGNIQRLLNGTESKVGKKPPADEKPSADEEEAGTRSS